MRYLFLSLFVSGCMAGKHHIKDLPDDTTSELPDCAGPSYPCAENEVYLINKYETISTEKRDTQ
jgi:hypothetical protein